ncbi:AMP-binding protein [Nocardia sp. 348MFTsu5.1]|uniref:AMP-binding protein n=1 Tax=Nocardia sp. 348MFTsu5.1 TaxID=1172185 RepID=UPI00037A124E|nr:AMP-binding protein [Nocardia sp. 348MFTsu5.1]
MIDARTSLILMKANTSVFERPDRIGRAMRAAIAHGNGMLGAVAASAARYPEVTAVSAPGHRVTYRDLWQGSNALARGLARAGVGPSSRVGVLCRNTPTFVYALLGAAKLGADIVLLNTAMGPGQLADVIEHEQLTTVLHDDDFGRVLKGIDGVRTIDATEIALLSSIHRSANLSRPRQESRLIILTSGTTGRPKGAARSSGGSGIDGVAALLGAIPLRLRDTVVVSAPFFHAWGLANLLIGLGLSATIVTAPEFDAAQTLSLVSRRRARALVVVPVMLQRMCSLPPEQLAAIDTSSLAIIASSGSALPGRLATEVLDRFGPTLYNVYGSTEVATATVAGPTDLRTSPTTAGRPAPGVRVSITDDDGKPVDAGAIGRIFVANAARFDGYTGGGGKEIVNGQLSTGDKGYFDEHGRLFVVGRDDDMIVSGGENVYPSEVEDFLNQDERITEAAVVGIDDDQFGQALKAVIVAKPGSDIDVRELKEDIAQNLAKYKVPRVFEFVDELPRNATGKILRRQLRPEPGVFE